MMLPSLSSVSSKTKRTLINELSTEKYTKFHGVYDHGSAQPAAVWSKETVLQIDGTDQQFVLVGNVQAKPDPAQAGALNALREAVARGDKKLSVTGYVDGWVGRWPGVLARRAAKRPRLMVTSFQAVKEEE